MAYNQFNCSALTIVLYN